MMQDPSNNFIIPKMLLIVKGKTIEKGKMETIYRWKIY